MIGRAREPMTIHWPQHLGEKRHEGEEEDGGVEEVDDQEDGEEMGRNDDENE